MHASIWLYVRISLLVTYIFDTFAIAQAGSFAVQYAD